MKKWFDKLTILSKVEGWILVFLMIAILCLPVLGFAQAPVSGTGQVNLNSAFVGRGDMVVPVKAENYWIITCYDRYGNLKWTEKFPNLVVTNGLNLLLNDVFKSGTAAANWYVGLVGTTSTGFAAGDTMASHAGWAEISAYTLTTRPALTLGTVSGGTVDNSASVASFTINATTTVYGAFICDSSTKDTGVGIVGLYGEGAFTTSRSVISGDILNVTITLTVTASDAGFYLFEFLNHWAMLREPFEDFRYGLAA